MSEAGSTTATYRKSILRKRKVNELSGKSENRRSEESASDANQARDGEKGAGELATEEPADSPSVLDHPLLRDESMGMNPQQLLTGYFGSRGERIRHTVHEGALRLPSEALEIIYSPSIMDPKWMCSNFTEQQQEQMKRSKGKSLVDLPALDSVKRPSLDSATHKSIVVTQVRLSRVQVPHDPVIENTGSEVVPMYKYQTHIHNTQVPVEDPPTAERIRGGGGETEGDSGHDGKQGNPLSSNEAFLPPPPDIGMTNLQGIAGAATQPSSAQLLQQQQMLHQQQLASIEQTHHLPEGVNDKDMQKLDGEQRKIQQHQLQLQQIHQQHVQMRQQQLQQQQEELRRQHEQTEEQQRHLIQHQDEQLRNQQQEKNFRQQQLRQQQQQLQLQHEQQKMAAKHHHQTLRVVASASHPDIGRIEQQQQHMKSPPGKTSSSFSNPATAAAANRTSADPVSVSATPVVAAQLPVEHTRSGKVSAGQHHVAMTQSYAKPSDENTKPSVATSSGSSTQGPPLAARSSSPKPAQHGKKQLPVVVGLKEEPDAQWEQHVPGPNDEMGVDASTKAPKPEWYKPDGISHLEQTVLSEWFDNSASHRTPDTYRKARETMVKISTKLGTRYLTATMARRSIPGDAGSLIRLHEFLCAHSLINEDSINDSAPTPAALQMKGKLNIQWPQARKQALLQAVVEESRKRQERGEVGIDWDSVANQVGDGALSTECESEFLKMEIQELPQEGSITPETQRDGEAKDNKLGEADMLRKVGNYSDLLDSCDPTVVHAVTEAAFASTMNVNEAQRAALGGLAVSQDIREAVSQEGTVARLLAEVVDLRMKKLENRLAMLDDMEGLLEAERVALELERRDLYTARCRNWFGGP